MSLAIYGPIGLDRLAEFAISRVFRVEQEHNRGTASCKLCGATLLKGTGHRIVIADASELGQPDHAYACDACVTRIKTAAARFEGGLK